jgi:hypothetical protein
MKPKNLKSRIMKIRVWEDAYAGALYAILCTINGFESLEMNYEADEARERLLWPLRDQVELHTGNDTQEGLARYDAVFQEAGWDDQGWRWATEPGCAEQCYLVRFTNKKHTEWEIV